MIKVETQPVRLEIYVGIAPENQLAEARAAAEMLKGLRVVHINATPVGGGVAEILKSLVPLMQGVGIDTSWYALEPDEHFFHVTKALHHCLQGEPEYPKDEEIEYYLSYNQKAAQELQDMGVGSDIFIIHDAQVLPFIPCLGTDCPSIWVCHVDTTKPNDWVRQTLLPYTHDYQRILFSMPEYHLEGLNPAKVSVFPPAIDPLTIKNMPFTKQEAREKLIKLSIDPARPLVSQVSRFDRWKDPWGVIDAYRLARGKIPGLQLALVGAMNANDDPDAVEVFKSVQKYAANDTDIHLFSDPVVITSIEVNAFQSGSDVIVQKSTREGFGLTVAEAMWKRTPVIGGNCGGIRLQIQDGETGFLVSDVPSCTEKIVTLLEHHELAERMGETGRESVRNGYLVPRLLKDYLKLMQNLVSSGEPSLSLAA
jgi:trehalose synthase